MKHLASYLIIISIPLFMISACQADRLNEPKAPITKKHDNKLTANDDCLDDNSNTLKPIGAIIAQGCPVNLN